MKPALWALALTAALADGSAWAADLPSRKASFDAPPPVFAWTGLYAGLDIGGGWLAGGPSNGGVSGGGQVGYNYRLGPLFVVGLETDFQGTSLSGGGGKFDPLGLRPPRNIEWFGTVRGRVGVTAFDSRVLLYGTGGFAYGETGRGVGEGWTAGGGVEWAFAPRWSVKTEYLFADLRKSGGEWGAPPAGARFHTVRVGVNHHFDLFAPRPGLGY